VQSGRSIGRVVDLVADLDRLDDQDRPLVSRLVVRDGRTLSLVGWPDVESFGIEEVRLRPDAEVVSLRVDLRSVLNRGELLLGRDALDVQVLDLTGRRLARVSDVLLAGEGTSIVVIALDVGFGSVLRRLGLRRVSERRSERLLPWPSVHLVSAVGHGAQLRADRSAVRRLNADDLAEVLPLMPVQRAADVLAAVPTEVAGEALAASHEQLGRRLAEALPDEPVAPALAHAARLHPARAARLRLARAARGRRWPRFGRHGGWRSPRRRFPTMRHHEEGSG
jgi:hypothetical protein